MAVNDNRNLLTPIHKQPVNIPGLQLWAKPLSVLFLLLPVSFGVVVAIVVVRRNVEILI